MSEEKKLSFVAFYRKKVLSKDVDVEVQVDQQVLKLHLLKDEGRGLGIQVTSTSGEKKGIFVSHLLDDGAAARDGRIQIGDEILLINGYSLIGVQLQHAIQLLRFAKNPIQIIVTREVQQPIHEIEKKKNQGNLDDLPFNPEDVDYTFEEVVLINGKHGKQLGFSIVGGANTHTGIFIKNILPDGLAAMDSRLRINDEIVQLNDMSLGGVTHEDAVYLFKSLGKGAVRLLVKRRVKHVRHNATMKKQDIFKVVLNKVNGKSLGIGVVALGRPGNKGYGIFVKYIAKGLAMNKACELCLKDQILYINDVSLKSRTLDETYKILRNLPPGKVTLTVKRPQQKNKKSENNVSKSKLEAQDSLAALMTPAMQMHKNTVVRKDSSKSAISLCSSTDSEGDDNTTPFEINGKTNKNHVKIRKNRQTKTTTTTASSSSSNWLDEGNSTKVDGNAEVEVYDPENQVVSLQQHSSLNEDKNNETQNKLHHLILHRDKSGMIKRTANLKNTPEELLPFSGSLGLNLKIKKSVMSGAHAGIFAKAVVPGGAADKALGSEYGGVRNGDEIIQVNDKILEHLSHNAVIALFKNIPKKSIFVIKRSTNETAVYGEDYVHEKKCENTGSTVKDSSEHILAVPNSVNEPSGLKTLIQHNSVLTDQPSTRNDHTHPFVATKPTSEPTQSPITTMLTLTSDHTSRQSMFKLAGKEILDIPLPDPSAVPDDCNAHLITIVKQNAETLGLSLVAGSKKFHGYYQVRRILPASPCEMNGQIYCGDCLYSVNGINMNGLSHPQALQVLKQCSTNAKLVIFREKERDQEMLDRMMKNTSRIKPGPCSMTQNPSSHKVLPGVITTDATPNQQRAPLIRKVTAGSSVSLGSSIPTLLDDVINNESSSQFLNKVPQNSLQLSDNESDEHSSTHASLPTPDIPRVVAVNRRSPVGPFMVEYEKIFKGLGIDVFVDSNGECCVANVMPNGLIGADNRIRVGDTLLSINGELLTGKPISDICNIIRCVPRGQVQVIVKAYETDQQNSPSLSHRSVRYDDQESVASTTAYQQSETGLSLFSAPLPEDKKTVVLSPAPSSIFVPPPPSFNVNPDIPLASHSRLRKLSDVSGSDFTTLPPAPPRAIMVPEKTNDYAVFSDGDDDVDYDDYDDEEEEDDGDDDSDLESMFSCIPVAPPPVKNFQQISSNNYNNGNMKENINKHVQEKIDKKSRLDEINQKFRHELLNSTHNEMNESALLFSTSTGVEVEKSKADPPPLSVMVPQSNATNVETRKPLIHVTDSLHTEAKYNPYEEIDKLQTKNYDSQSKTQAVDKSEHVPHMSHSPSQERKGNIKGKSLLAKLKSKIILPNRNNVKEKKEKTSRSRTSSSSGGLRASTSQPDLTFNPFDTYVVTKKSNLKKTSSVDDVSQAYDEIPSQNNVGKLQIHTAPLPKILSFKRNDKNKRRRRKSSPPSSPPPPPPIDFEDEMTNGIAHNSSTIEQEDNTFSPQYEFVSTPPEESPYETVDGLNIDHYARSESSSGINSYAVEGPTALKTPDDSEEKIDSFDSLDVGSRRFSEIKNNYPVENNTAPISSKPIPPPKPLNMGTSRYNDHYRSLDSLPTAKMDSPPTLKKRGSSLLHINFPPPPCYDIDDEKNTQSNHTSPSSSQHAFSELSEKDKSDPKLQPFVMTEHLLNSLPTSHNQENLTIHSIGDRVRDESSTFDDDDWGSEFSTSVYEGGSRLNSSASNYSNQQHRYDNLSKFQSLPATPTNKQNKKQLSQEGYLTPSSKSKVKEMKALFNRKPNQSDAKERNRRRVKSTSGIIEISQPILTNRKTFSEMFSKQQLAEYGFPKDVRSHDDLVQQAIKNNLVGANRDKGVLGTPLSRTAPIGNMNDKLKGHQRSRSESNLSSLSMASGSYAVPDQTVVTRSKQDIHTNPLPKPPRRGTMDNRVLLTASEYANHEQIQSTFEPQLNMNRSHDFYENLSSYQPNSEDTGNLRPVPTIPYEEISITDPTSLPSDKLDALYAKIDYSQKRRTQNVMNLSTDSFTTDATDYTIPERNNNNIIYNNNTTPHQIPSECEQKEFIEGMFRVQLLRTPGENLGFTIAGGSDSPIKTLLIRYVEGGSIAERCTIPLRRGDEIIEVNTIKTKGKGNIQKGRLRENSGCTHSEVLNLLHNSPPLVQMVLLRRQYGNEEHLHHLEEVVVQSPVYTETNLKQFEKYATNSKQSHIVQVENSPNSRRNSLRLTTETFEKSDFGGKLNQVLQAAPSRKQSYSDRSRSNTVSSVSTSTSVSTVKNQFDDNTFQIDLHKQEGRGLGIAVYGGPKHVIKYGIKVKKLVSGSLAYLDGRLQSGDVIVAINNQSLIGLSQGEALALLKDIPKTILLTVERNLSPTNGRASSLSIHECRTTPLPPRAESSRSRRGSVKESPVTPRRSRSKSRDKESPATSRRSRSKNRDDSHSKRSRSETRQKPPTQERPERPRSLSRLSRLFGGSKESLNASKKK